MDAPPLSSDPRAELAALRRRAYGPNADIHHDAAALARLNALEEAVRVEEEASAQRERAMRAAERNTNVDEPSVRTSRPSISMIDDVSLAREGRSSPAATVAPLAVREPGHDRLDTDAGSTSVPEQPATTRWWRRIHTRWLVAAAVVAGMIIGLALPMLLPPFPDATLSKMGDPGVPMPMEEDVGTIYSAQDETGQLYEQFEGMDLWTVESENGGMCLYVIADGSWVAAGCAPEGLAVIADAQAYPGSVAFLDDLPEGSVVRFEVRGDVIDVWVVAADDPA